MSESEFNYIVRLSGTDCRGDWFVPYALSRVKGIGPRLAHLACQKAEISPYLRIGQLDDEEIRNLEDIITNPTKFGVPAFLLNRQKDPVKGENLHVTGNDLLISLKDDIDRQKKIRSWRGIRHGLGLKVRGQKTRSSGRGGQTIGVARRKKGQ